MLSWKMGKELTFEVTQREFKLKTLNDSHQAFTTFIFSSKFFDYFEYF